MADVDGTCETRFDGVRKALAASLDAGTDVGASVAVLPPRRARGRHLGRLRRRGQDPPGKRDTITNVWSTTKTMTFLCALMLADRGELDFHAPVATYWPEFADGGKEDVEVRHLMGHTAGLSGWEEPLDGRDLADWEQVHRRPGGPEAMVGAGSASGYHAVTQGYLIGEVVRRITGDTIGTWFAREVATPLGADFHIGLPESEDGRVSNVIPPPPIDLKSLGATPSELMAKTFLNPVLDATASHHAWWRRAEIPAADGQGNARSVALVQSIVAGRGQARRRAPALRERHRPDLRGAGQRHGPGARWSRCASAWATA